MSYILCTLDGYLLLSGVPILTTVAINATVLKVLEWQKIYNLLVITAHL